MSDVKTLYDQDIFAWSKQQAEALRSVARGGSNQALDWDNLAEEIEDLGRSQQSALQSQVRRIIGHFLKLEYCRMAGPRRGWRASIVDARVEIDILLKHNPSLVSELGAIVAEEHSARRARPSQALSGIVISTAPLQIAFAQRPTQPSKFSATGFRRSHGLSTLIPMIAEGATFPSGVLIYGTTYRSS